MILTRRNVLAFAAVLMAATPIAADTTNLRVHTAQPGSSAFAFTTTYQTVAQRELPVRFNVTSGMTSTRSTLDAARGQVDLYISAPAIVHFMSTGSAMYKDMADAPDLAKNLRGIVNFPLGPYHILTYAESGIESLEDIKGKRVFLGPPGGAATTVGLAIVESVTGYKPDVDYDQAKLDWTAGNQAFQDRQVDLAIIPTELPSANVQQFALLSEIRLIDIPLESFDIPPLKNMISLPGRTIVDIPPDIYGQKQVNEKSVRAVGSFVGIGVSKDLDENLVYDITRVLFENIEDFHNAAEWMKVVTLETALLNMNAPLHPGAYRYYTEQGVEVPEELVPPRLQ